MAAVTNIDNRLNDLRELERRVEGLSKDLLENSSGGGGTGGPVDHRITRVEGRIDSLSEKLADVREELAGVRAKLEHMPTRFEFYTVVIGTASLFAALVKLGVL